MPALALFILAGTLAGLYVRMPVPAGAVAFLFLFWVPLAWWLTGRHSAAFTAALLWASLDGSSYLAHTAPALLYGKDLVVQGCVADFPRHDARGARFIFRLQHSPDLVALGDRLLLRTYAPDLQLVAGGCWQFLVRLKPPHGLTNPGQFDRGLWLYREDVHATGYVRSSRLNRPLPAVQGNIWLVWRETLRVRLQRLHGDSPVFGILAGISIGARADVAAEQWALFRRTGTSHLMAISGLHIGLVAAFFWCAGRAAGRWVAGGPGTGEAIAAALSVAAAVGYALLAGFSTPTMRAAIMTLVIVSLRCVRRPTDATAVLAFVMICSVVSRPVTVLEPGFWLSYLAVFTLLNLVSADNEVRAHEAGPARRIYRHLRATLRVQAIMWLALLLPGLVFFGQIAWFAPLLNAFCIPWFSLAVLPATLAATALAGVAPELAQPLLRLAGGALELMLVLLERAAVLSPSWSPVQPGFLGWAAGCAGLLLILLPRPARCLPAGVLLLLVCIPFLRNGGEVEGLRINVLDVGQGTSVLIRSGGYAALVDTGPAWPGGDAGAAQVLPILRHFGVRALDLVVVSHADADHAGGLGSLLAGMPVRQILGPPELTASQPGLNPCKRGMFWDWGASRIEILHPASYAGWSDNNASCVVSIKTAGGQRVLLPGDIETPAERVLVARERPGPVTLALVPHHGSKTSSTPELVAHLSTRFAVVTAGFRNRWNFPVPEVVARWQGAGACVLNTATTGGLQFDISAAGHIELTRVETARRTRPWPLRTRLADVCPRGGATL